MSELCVTQLQKVGLELLDRNMHSIVNPTVVEEFNKNELFICGQMFCLSIRGNGKTKKVPQRLYTVKYLEPLDIILGITVGLPNVVFLSNLPDFPLISEPYRISMNYVNQVFYRNNILVFCGSGVEVYEIKIKKLHFDILNPKIELKQISFFSNNLSPSLLNKIYVDFTNQTVLVPNGTSLTQYSFTGEKLIHIKNFSPTIMRTTGMIVVSPKNISKKCLFKKFTATDSFGTIKVWGSNNMILQDVKLPNALFIYSEFIDKENILLATEKSELYILNTKSGVITSIFQGLNKFMYINVFHNPERVAIIYNSSYEFFKFNIPFKFYLKTSYFIDKVYTINNSYVILDSNGGLRFMNSKNKDEVKNVIPKNGTSIRNVFIKKDYIYYLFNDYKMEKYISPEETKTYLYSTLFFETSPDGNRNVIITTKNELLVLDKEMTTIVGKTRVNANDVLDLQVLDHNILVFMSNQIIFVSDNISIKARPINPILHVTHNEERFCMLYVNGQLVVCDSQDLTVLCSFSCGSTFSSIRLQNDYFVILKGNVVFLGRPGCNIIKFCADFPVKDAWLLDGSDNLLIASTNFIMSVCKEEYFPWLTENSVTGYSIFSEDKDKLPKLKIHEIRPPVEPVPTGREKTRLRLAMPKRGSITAREVRKLSWKTLLHETKAMNKSENMIGVTPLPELNAKKKYLL